jgi:hypothetical protein
VVQFSISSFHFRTGSIFQIFSTRYFISLQYCTNCSSNFFFQHSNKNFTWNPASILIHWIDWKQQITIMLLTICPPVQQTTLLQLPTKVNGITGFRHDGMQILGRFGTVIKIRFPTRPKVFLTPLVTTWISKSETCKASAREEAMSQISVLQCTQDHP